MGKLGGQVLGLGFGVVGGLVGGFFTAGAFSGVGFGIGMSIGGLFLAPKSKRSNQAPNIDGTQVPFFGTEVLGTVGNITPHVIQCGRDKQGNPAGVMIVSQSEDGGAGCGAGGSFEGDKYYITLSLFLASTHNTGPVFIDEIGVEEGGQARLLFNRYGTTEKERGFELVPQFKNGELIAEVSEGLRLYPGSALQMPDTAMQELWGNEVSANRLSAYCVLNKVEFSSVPTFKFTLRNSLTGRREIIRRRLLASGVPPERIRLTKISGNINGAAITSPTSAREVAERLAMPVFCQLLFNGEQIVDADAANPDIIDVDEAQLGARANAVATASRDTSEVEAIEKRAAEDLPSEVTLPFSDVGLNYDSNEAFALRGTAGYTNSQNLDTLNEVSDLSTSVKIARAKLDEAATADRTWRASVLPRFAHAYPGDVFRVTTRPPGRAARIRFYRINEREREPSTLLNFAGTPWSAHVFNQPGVLNTPQRPAPSVLVPGQPVLFVCETVPLLDTMRSEPGLFVAACAQPGDNWRRVLLDTDDASRVQMKTQAQIGQVLQAFNFQRGQAFDYNRSVSVSMFYGVPQTASEAAVLKGANRALLDTGRVFSFVQAIPTGPGTFALSGIRDGEFGTDSDDGDFDITEEVGAGARVLLLTDNQGRRLAGPQFVQRQKRNIGVTGLKYWFWVDGQEHTEVPYIMRGENLKCPAPTAIEWTHTAGGATITGQARDRIIEDQEWSNELGSSDPLKFDIWLNDGQFLNHVTKTASGAAFSFTITPGELLAMFGAAPTSLTGWIAQVNSTGAGRRAYFGDQITNALLDEQSEEIRDENTIPIEGEDSI
jgi:hypothetical protein